MTADKGSPCKCHAVSSCNDLNRHNDRCIIEGIAQLASLPARLT